jgi:uncharacterized membrane protein YphA (DoxX/SURF4 family)
VRLASSFHGGLLGAGLLLLRLGIGATAVLEGLAYVSGPNWPGTLACSVAVAAMVSGGALMLGLLTPVASFVLCLDVLVPELLSSPESMPSLFGARISTVLIVVVSAAIALAGPGAVSIDARLFGLRRIRIPRTREQRL